MPQDSLFFLLFVIAALVVLIRAAYLHWFSDAAVVRRKLRQMPRTLIRDVKSGDLVKLVGHAQPVEQPLAAPLTGRPCTFYEVTVEQYSARRGKNWFQIAHEQKAVSFLLEDDTGRAFVDSRALKVAPTKGKELTSGLLDNPAPELEAFLQRHGKTGTGWFFNKKLRYRESVLAPGKVVAVAGRARLERDPDPTAAGSGYRDGPQRVVLEPLPEGSVLASDEPDTRQ